MESNTKEEHDSVKKTPKMSDSSGRGRGIPGLPLSGPPRPVFKPPVPADPKEASQRGRGRGTPLRSARGEKPTPR